MSKLRALSKIYKLNISLKIIMVSEVKEEQIRAEARAMLEKFSKSLGNVKVSSENNVNDESSGFRSESEGEESNEDFRDRMFANAPNVEGDFIIAEKKKW